MAEKKRDTSIGRNLGGRPSKYTKEIAIEIIERLEKNESLRSICRDEHLPERQTVYNWIMDEPGFFDRYARAKEIGYEQDVEDMVKWCDQAIESPQQVQGYRLKIDTLKWIISKKLPKKYGEKQMIEHSGSIQNDIYTMTRDERQKRIEELEKKRAD